MRESVSDGVGGGICLCSLGWRVECKAVAESSSQPREQRAPLQRVGSTAAHRPSSIPAMRSHTHARTAAAAVGPHGGHTSVRMPGSAARRAADWTGHASRRPALICLLQLFGSATDGFFAAVSAEMRQQQSRYSIFTYDKK